MYLSVYGESQTEKVIEKSRFLTFVSHVSGEDEAREFLARVKGLHSQATHVCYGFIADGLGNLQRFSDAGEPQGTAGLPILGAIKARNLFETAVAVVRYFGGIKLGAGGLVRAYSSSATEGLNAAEVRAYEPCVKIKITVGYPEVSALTRFLEREGTEFTRNFSDFAEFTAAVREREKITFLSALREALNGRANTEEGETFIYPFPISK